LWAKLCGRYGLDANNNNKENRVSREYAEEMSQSWQRWIIMDSECLSVGRRGGLRCLSRVVVSRIRFRADVFKAKRPNRRHLRDVLTGFRPVEMGRIAGQNDDAAGRIRLQLIGVELIAQADVEKNAGVSGESRDQKSRPLMASSVKGGGILGFCFFYWVWEVLTIKTRRSYESRSELRT